MKKMTKFFALVLLAGAMVSCNTEDTASTTPNGKVAVQFTGGISVNTRASETTWDNGDRIGITDIDNDTQYGNVPFILKNGKFEAEGKVIYIEDTKPHTFRAYYPYNAAGGILAATTDATAQQNQPAIDFLFASGATGDKNNPVVSFTDKTAKGGEDNSFHHRMSQITLTFEAGDGGGESGEAKDLGYIYDSNTNTYTVYNADGLMNVAELVNGGKTDINITLDKNIDLTGKGWTPIGTNYDNSYTGTFDGGGHTIKGLTVTTNDQFVGLFGYLNRAGTVKNVVMEGIQITSNHMFGCTGGVVGYSWGTIENCSVSGSVSGTDCVGGVVGSQKAGSIIGCSSSATVKGTHYVGGVAGEKWGTMIACYATGNVTLEIGSPKNLSGGGVVGLNGGSRVLACYAIGNVNSKGSSTGNVHIGGLFGDNYTVVTACYWKNNQEQGIGRNQHNTAPEATKVDGTDVTWQKAVDAMNTALQNAGSGWRYELNGALPTLRKL